MVMSRQSCMRFSSFVAKILLRILKISSMAEVCIELESHADRSRSVSAQVTVSGIEMSSAGLDILHASDTVRNLLSYSESQLGIKWFIKLNMPVSSH